MLIWIKKLRLELLSINFGVKIYKHTNKNTIKYYERNKFRALSQLDKAKFKTELDVVNAFPDHCAPSSDLRIGSDH